MATLDIENARVLFKNFSGAKSEWNRNGTRSVDIIIEDADVARMLAEDGWNIKQTKVRDEGDEPEYYVNIILNFESAFGGPDVTLRLVDSDGNLVNRVKLDENTVSSLDKLKILFADVRINPHEWEMGGRSGIKGYVDTMIVTARQDPFMAKYAEEEFPTE